MPAVWAPDAWFPDVWLPVWAAAPLTVRARERTEAAAAFLRSIMVGTSLGPRGGRRFFGRIGGLVGKGDVGFVLRPEGLADDSLDVRRGDFVVLPVEAVDGIQVAGDGDGGGGLVGDSARSVEAESEVIAQVRLDAVEPLLIDRLR